MKGLWGHPHLTTQGAMAIDLQALPRDVLCMCVSYTLNLSSLLQISSLSTTFHRIVLSSEAWEGHRIMVPAKVQASPRLVVLAQTAWSGCSSLCLDAGPLRQPTERALKAAGFNRPMEVAGHGPLMLFYMGAFFCLSPGQHLRLHLFEPRYRWMCCQLFGAPALPGPHNRHLQWQGAPVVPKRPVRPGNKPAFGFITRIGPSFPMLGEGAQGMVAEVLHYAWNPDGTCDVTLRAVQRFTVLEVFSEVVPGFAEAPKLHLAFVDLATSEGQAQGTSPFSPDGAGCRLFRRTIMQRVCCGLVAAASHLRSRFRTAWQRRAAIRGRA